jgi:hypothetical protein
MALSNVGNIYVTGSGGGDYTTLKYNNAGIEQWVATYDGPGNSSDEAFDITVDGRENVYVTGMSVALETHSDYATIKYNSAGTEEWIMRYNGIGNSGDIACAITVDSKGSVYVTGSSSGLGTEEDYTTIKYSQPLSINRDIWMNY